MIDKDILELSKEYLMEVDTNISISSVILSEENKAKIMEFIKEQENRDKLLEYGLQPMNRLLFYGASGCGKTYLAKALSNHLKYRMLYVDIAKSLSEGNIAMNISNIFKIANTLKRCVIFLDECDSIAWNRDSNVSNDGGNIRRATNSIFQHLDQMDVSNIFISATNMLHRLDPAFERRFNMKLEFKKPSTNLKETIQKFLYSKFELVDDVNVSVQEIVERRARLSYYEIQGIVERAMKKAVLNGTNKVHTADIYKDIAISNRIRIMYDKL
ncbi:MAG: ATP-binding protein [Candidatus Anstonellales archaeon]